MELTQEQKQHYFQQLAAEAIQVQDACNLSGVAHSLARVCRELRDAGVVDTESRNTHAIVKMFVAKLADLARVEYQFPIEAYQECKNLASDEIEGSER